MRAAIICITLLCITISAEGAEFFSIEKVRFHDKPTRDGVAFYEGMYNAPRGYQFREEEFIPFLEATVRTKQQVRADMLYGKAYFYDRDNNLIARSLKPSRVQRNSREYYTMPALFAANNREKIYFVLPPKVRHTQGWKALIVFGDEHAAAAEVYPRGRHTFFDFPERKQVDEPKRVERKAAMDPLIEHVVETGVEKHPQITLFLRPPIGMTDASEAKGVLALCVLANRLEDIRRRLQLADAKDEVGGLLRFAEKHKLLIISWGSRNLWNPRKNWDEYKEGALERYEENFDAVSDAWARGVRDLARKYGIPTSGFLLWGSSGSAQFAKRLAMRKPEYFHAIHLHIPSSFDRPTQEASKLLWCLTTGELEPGYERSLQFYGQCREMGYPMIYKAIMGLGHAGHPAAFRLGKEFFAYALELLAKQKELSLKRDDPFAAIYQQVGGGIKKEQSWKESFTHPPYFGDIVNQEVYPANEVTMIPEAFRTPLPSREIAKSWESN